MPELSSVVVIYNRQMHYPVGGGDTSVVSPIDSANRITYLIGSSSVAMCERTCSQKPVVRVGHMCVRIVD